ncbi:MAK10-like protein [Tanacetum coccineum]
MDVMTANLCKYGRGKVGYARILICVDACESDDLKSTRFFYTWSKSPQQPTTSIFKKLDRVVMNDGLLQKFCKAYALFLPYMSSDHCLAILIILNEVDKKFKAFRFTNYIADKDDFLPNVFEISAKESQSMMDKDLFNKDIKKMECEILKEFTEAVMDEEKLLFQQAKVDWFLALGWYLEEIHPGDDVITIKRWCHDIYGDNVRDSVTASGSGRLKVDLEPSTWQRRQEYKATPDENPIRTLGDYSKPSHEGYRNTIELPVGNNVVPLRSDTIWLVQNGCSFHRLWSEDLNKHLKDFLKLVDSLDLDGENRERTCLRLFQFSLRDQASNWLERLPAGSITKWENLTTRFLAQFFSPGRTAKLHNDILMFQQHHGESLSEAWTYFKDLLQKVPHHGIDLWLQVQIFFDHANPVTRRTIDQSAGVKAVTLPQGVLSTSDCHLIELKNQVQRLMEAHLALTQPTQVNNITTSCKICSGPHDTQYCMEDPEQSFVEYASSRTNEAGKGLVSNFMASQDARLSKFEADFKQQQNEMTNKIDTVLKAITDRIAGTLPSDTVKNPKLSTSPQQNDSRDSMDEEEKQEREGDLEDTNTLAYIEERRDTPLLERKDIAAVDNLGSNKDDEGIEWLDVEEPLYLVDTSEEFVYESIKEMPKCLLNYDFRIKKGDPRNLKIPCMIGHKFTANAYIDVDLPMNIKVILSEDDYDRGCRKPSDLEDGFYKDTIKLGPEYLTGMDDEGEVT